jgi:glycosyltransferase involved in cell wall biosynthesis
MYRFARALAERFDVHLFSAADPHDVRVDPRAPELAIYAAVHIVPRRSIAFDFGKKPARVRAVTPPALLRALTDAQSRTPFAAAVVEHSYSALPMQQLLRVPWVLDEHNVESEYTRARSSARRIRGPLVSHAVAAWNAKKVQALSRWEETQWRRATEVVCVSASDAQRVESIRKRAVTVIPNGVATEDVPFKPASERTGHDILLVGTFEHPPNISAARWLALEIMPRVWRSEPRARLVLCGSRPARSVLELANDRVLVTGAVPSVVPYLQQARVYANAVQHGGGTSLKVLEALASGVPLVSTAVGVRGFELTSPDDYLQAEDTESFVRQLVSCLASSEPRDAASERGRKLAERCSWTKLAARFSEVVQHALDLNSGARATAPGVVSG